MASKNSGPPEALEIDPSGLGVVSDLSTNSYSFSNTRCERNNLVLNQLKEAGLDGSSVDSQTYVTATEETRSQANSKVQENASNPHGATNGITPTPSSKVSPQPQTDKRNKSSQIFCGNKAPTSILEGKSPSLPLDNKNRTIIPLKFLPTVSKQITKEWAKEQWLYANHFSKHLPKESPTEENLNDYQQKLRHLYEFVVETLRRCLLEHYKTLAQENLVEFRDKCLHTNPQVAIEAIQKAVMSQPQNDNYLKNVLLFLKIPLKHNIKWLVRSVQIVEDQYSIVFPSSGEKHFVSAIAQSLFNDCFNQRLRRTMVLKAGFAWYDRRPSEKGRATTFGQGVPTEVEYRKIQIGMHVLKGHIIRRVGQVKYLTDEKKETVVPQEFDKFIEEQAGARNELYNLLRRTNR